MRKEIGYKKSIKFKIALAICCAVLIIGTIGLGVGYFLGFRFVRNLIGENYAQMAGLLADSINRSIAEEVTDIETYVDSQFWKRSIAESNLKYENMSPESVKRFFSDADKKWKEATSGSPILKEYLGKPLSLRLKKLTANSKSIVEIFVTDKKGALVASSGRTSDFYQADEEWWKHAFDGGKGKSCVEKIEFDESSDTWVLPIAVPLRDESGGVIGVCKSMEAIEKFLGHVEAFKIDKNGHAVLINRKGDIIVHREIEPFTGKFVKEEVLRKIYSTKRKWDIVNDPHIHKGKVFIAYAEIAHPYLIESGIKWTIFIDQDSDEVFAPLRRLFRHMSVVVLIMLLTIIPVGFIFGGILAAPIKKLTKATKNIAKGDLDYNVKITTGDEIEELARSFGEMILAIKEDKKVIVKGRDKFKNLSRSLDRKVGERTKELSKAQEAALNMLEDLTEAKENLEKAMVVKSEFTSMVSHELRTPLTAIKEGIAIVLDGTAGKLNSEQKDFLDTAKRNVDRLARLINDVLDFQKLEAGRVEFRMEENDINEVAAEVRKAMVSVAAEKGLTLTFKQGKDLPRVVFDRDKIIQVLTNIINNAIKFTEKGGVAITTKTVTKKNFIQVCVSDTGPGVKKEDLPKLFQRFEQLEKGKERKTGSSGLGLAISREIIERHKGKIWAESEPGKGMTVDFTLPIKERRA